MTDDYDCAVTIASSSPRKDDVLAIVDEFEIIRPLGAGGFGNVYLARNLISGIEVALKVIGKNRKGRNDTKRTRRTIDSKELEVELRENFKLIHGLTHPNIAVSYPLHLVREVKQKEESVSISCGDILSVMAFAPGVILDKWRMMIEGGRVPILRATDILMQIASALDYAHENGVIHRDVKPSNIMIDTREGCKPLVRLLDFGLAATTDGGCGVCGTPQYMSPEQWCGKHQDWRTDQYALAVLACELLTGHVPLESVFAGGDREVMRVAVMNREVEFPKGLSSKQRRAIAKAMAKSPDGRFVSCKEFVTALTSRSWWSLIIKIILITFGLIFVGAALFLGLKDNSVALVSSIPEQSVSVATIEPDVPNSEPPPVLESTPIPVQAPVAVSKPDPAPIPAPKQKLSTAIQEKLRKADQEYADLKSRYQDPTSYEEIERIRQRITELQNTGEYEQVGMLGGEYFEMLREKRKALSEQVASSVSSAKKSLVALDWSGLAKACDEVLSIEPRNQEALELRQRLGKSSMLQTAMAFAEKKRWRECLDATIVVLQLDPDNTQAKRLKARAENGLSTKNSPRVVTPQNTLHDSRNANGLELFNQRNADDDWRHKENGGFK